MKKIERKKEIVEVKITTIFCDKCKGEIKEKPSNAFCCRIELQTGEYDGYDGTFHGDNYRVDLCNDCANFIFFDLFPNNNINVVDEDDEDY